MTTRTIARWCSALVASTLVLLGAGGAVSHADEAAVEPRAAILVLDTSASMRPADVAAARDAALAYAATVPADVRIGLIWFAGKPELVTRPTTDRTELAEGLAGLRAGHETWLRDAIRLGVSTVDKLGADAERRLVVLTDGVDTSSASSLLTVRNALVGTGVVADFVAFRSHAGDMNGMRQLAEASGGRVLTAEDAPELAAAFAAIAKTAPSAGSADQKPAWLSWLPALSWQIGLLAGLTFVIVLVLLLVLFARAGGDAGGRRVLDQIARYGHRRDTARSEQQPERSFAGTAVGLTERVLRSRGWEEKLTERLDLASIRLKPAEWTLLRACASVVVAALLILMGANVVVGIVLGGVLGWAGPLMVVSIRIGRRRAAFGEQLPDVLQLIAGSLQSGFSLAQSLDAVVKEGTQPAAGEFSRALAETRIGAVLDDALDRIAVRMASDDLHWVVMAIRIQREVGGNLAEILLTTVTTMRERAQSRRQVRALSAEGRLSAYILLALPVAIGAFFYYSNPEYMQPLHTTAIGIVMLIGAAISMAVGSFWMSRLVKVEV